MNVSAQRWPRMTIVSEPFTVSVVFSAAGGGAAPPLADAAGAGAGLSVRVQATHSTPAAKVVRIRMKVVLLLCCSVVSVSRSVR
jgi:hypothetical protein